MELVVACRCSLYLCVFGPVTIDGFLPGANRGVIASRYKEVA
jgi:hypothetical protein